MEMDNDVHLLHTDNMGRVMNVSQRQPASVNVTQDMTFTAPAGASDEELVIVLTRVARGYLQAGMVAYAGSFDSPKIRVEFLDSDKVRKLLDTPSLPFKAIGGVRGFNSGSAARYPYKRYSDDVVKVSPRALLDTVSRSVRLHYSVMQTASSTTTFDATSLRSVAKALQMSVAKDATEW